MTWLKHGNETQRIVQCSMTLLSMICKHLHEQNCWWFHDSYCANNQLIMKFGNVKHDKTYNRLPKISMFRCLCPCFKFYWPAIEPDTLKLYRCLILNCVSYLYSAFNQPGFNNLDCSVRINANRDLDQAKRRKYLQPTDCREFCCLPKISATEPTPGCSKWEKV